MYNHALWNLPDLSLLDILLPFSVLTSKDLKACRQRRYDDIGVLKYENRHIPECDMLLSMLLFKAITYDVRCKRQSPCDVKQNIDAVISEAKQLHSSLMKLWNLNDEMIDSFLETFNQLYNRKICEHLNEVDPNMGLSVYYIMQTESRNKRAALLWLLLENPDISYVTRDVLKAWLAEQDITLDSGMSNTEVLMQIDDLTCKRF